MSGAVELASYVARRAAQRERVRLLYRRTLKDTLNWAVQRHIFLPRLPWAPGGSKFTRNPPPPPPPPPGIEVVHDYGKGRLELEIHHCVSGSIVNENHCWSTLNK